MKKFLRYAFTTALAVGASFAMSAQEAIDGYFRVQNAAPQNSSSYVHVSGPFTAQPCKSFEEAATLPGTVMYLNATPDPAKNGALRINSLQCQGIEVVGDPIQEYTEALTGLLNGNYEDNEDLLWAMVRLGFEHGYTSIGRAVLQSMIWVVAGRLDSEVTTDKETLADFADRFNKEVAANINLSIYLEPMGDGTYRLFYDVPDLQCVSEFYLKNDLNKETFENGFEAMRRYLTGKIGATGEYLQPEEIAEMKTWGYDPTIKHTNWKDMTDGRFLYTPYEEIFADHDLLFNWLKLNMIKFTDEDRCPKISLMGFYLPDFAKEMKNHALTAQLISYFPKLNTNIRCYLTDGKNNTFGHLDFTSAAGADALGAAACWQLHEVTAADGAYLCFPYEAKDEDGYYATAYVDFAMQIPANTKVYTIATGINTKEIGGITYPYYTLEEITGIVPARTPVLIEMTTDDAANHRFIPVDAPSTAAMTAEHMVGTLLPTPNTAKGFSQRLGLTIPEGYSAHALTATTIGKHASLWLTPYTYGQTIPANRAVMLVEESTVNGYAVKEPKADDTPITGEGFAGYFRVQNAGNLAAGFVNVSGPFTAQPCKSFEEAASLPGTVMYIDATPDPAKNGALRINSLRCQGIEVVGDPIQEYTEALTGLLNGSYEDNEDLLWAMVRLGFEHGYTSIGRAVLQSMIWVVAGRLDSEVTTDKETLADFADRFNKEVAANINLSIYLEPMADGTYRLFYDVPDLQCVSEFYLKNELNKESFELGFEGMRRYLTGKIGATGEYLQPEEIAEMKTWGYDPTIKHTNWKDTPGGRFLYTPFEEIFADHDLLFNWLKLNMIKFTDENRCPKITLMGFYLPDFAVEMKKHALTAQLISYFPKLNTNIRCYLTDGKNGQFGHLDFTSAEGANALGAAACWNVQEVTAEEDAYLYFPAQAADEDGYYATAYVDFAMETVNPDTKVYTLTAQHNTVALGEPGEEKEYCFYELEEIAGTIPARTPVIIEMTTESYSDHRFVPVVTENAANAPMRAAAGEAKHMTGTLLATPINNKSFGQHLGLYIPEGKAVHTLSATTLGTRTNLWFNEAAEGAIIPANQAALVMDPTTEGGYAVKEPKYVSGITDVTVDSPADDAVYNLNGFRVNEMLPGHIYIVGGKKVLAF